MSILTTIAGLFATQKTADTALSLVERFANSITKRKINT